VDPSGTVPLAVFTADCLGVALVSPAGPRALVHSGWRGTREGIVVRAVAALAEQGAAADALIAICGPSAPACCYRVGEEFRRYFADRFFQERDGALFFDNQGAVREQLLGAGLAARIFSSIRIARLS
jgi:copper oxidase (laccase) domain-containing protein